MAEEISEQRQEKPRKTLWDWLQLLLLPALLIAGILWLSIQQNQASLQMSKQQHDTAIQIAADQQQATILASYRDHISDMLLHNTLLESKINSDVRLVAQVETLTALRELKPAGKASVLRFLFETKLINNDYHVISLSDADLRGAALQGLDLRDTNLFGANLTGADLRDTNLSYATLNYTNLANANLAQADLHGSDMHFSDFTGANLAGANLKDATETNEQQLAKAKSLTGTIMPDGSTHQ
jgi:uncharacterized protein YjbI with pentapeptide repeats